MQQMTVDEIREKFLGFFSKRDHQLIPPSGIVPINDPTLLFINSGMAPMKRYFLSQVKPPCQQLTNVQDCIRTVDIDDVGDSYHGSSFRMMGSWSFGTYFKERAIELAFELITEGFGFSRDKLYATVLRTDNTLPNIPSDEESAKIWERFLPLDHIIWMPPQDNFWGPAGDTGPCGPCTEVFYDRGELYGVSSPNNPLVKNRHIEIWNAGVFMEYEKIVGGSIQPLPMRCVDTGAGLERFAMLLQDSSSIHEINQYQPAIAYISSVVGDLRWSRIILDHLKTSLLMLVEGVLPGNQHQSYVLRRLLRRVITGMHLRSVTKAELLHFSKVVAETMDGAAKISGQQSFIDGALTRELTSFTKVLNRADRYFDKIMDSNELTAELAFEMKATYGIPTELIQDFCREHSIAFPDAELAKLFVEHQDVSRKK